MVRVVFNASSLSRFHSGISVYALGLLRGFEALSNAPDVELFAQGRWKQSWRDFSVGGGGRLSPLVAVARRVPGVRRAFRAYQQAGFSRGVSRTQIDVYHEPNFVPFRFRGPTVLTVHDMAWVRYRQYLPQERLRFLQNAMPTALARAAAVIVPSAHVCSELEEDFPVARGKTYVVHNGKDSEFSPMEELALMSVLEPLGLRKSGYFLSVGTIEPRKNLIAVLDAYAALPQGVRQRFPLVVTGPEGWLDHEIRQRMAPMIERGELRFYGFVDRQLLVALYSGARAFVFASWYEGFGLPVVEAQACGTPVLASDRGSLPEVAGEGAIYTAPDDRDALVANLCRLAEDDKLVTRMRDLGLHNARRFDWGRCAAQTRDVYVAAA